MNASFVIWRSTVVTLYVRSWMCVEVNVTRYADAHIPNTCNRVI